MSVKTYETLFLLDSTKVSNDAEAAKNTLHHAIERFHGQVSISRPWDYNHKLSYPIRKSKKGSFHIVYYTMDSLKQSDLDREFKLLPDLVLRHMTLVIDPKWLDLVMGVAREDAGTGFAVRGMQEESAPGEAGTGAVVGEEGGEMAGAGGGGGYRRGRRFEGAGDKPA